MFEVSLLYFSPTGISCTIYDDAIHFGQCCHLLTGVVVNGMHDLRGSEQVYFRLHLQRGLVQMWHIAFMRLQGELPRHTIGRYMLASMRPEPL